MTYELVSHHRSYPLFNELGILRARKYKGLFNISFEQEVHRCLLLVGRRQRWKCTCSVADRAGK